MEVVIAIVVIGILALLAFGFWSMQQKKKSERLQGRFGPEYERAVSESGKKTEAERELAEREKRVQKLQLRDLNHDQQLRFAEEWRSVQAKFVDSPDGAIQEADALVQKVMDARGYPMVNFEQQAADISVDHPEVVQNYRAAHEIAEASDRKQASTEDLRQAMVHYRSLFAELLGAAPVR